MKTMSVDFLKSQGFNHTFLNRFWSKVDKSGKIPERNPLLGNCWKWTGSFIPATGGYGQLSKGGRTGLIRANRASWIIHFGAIPDGLWVLHKCDNPECTNPEHLWVGTRLENTMDMISKNRNAKREKMVIKTGGEKHYRTKLTWEKVREIRRLAKDGMHCNEIAEKFNSTHATVYQIVRNKCWDEKFAPHIS